MKYSKKLLFSIYFFSLYLYFFYLIRSSKKDFGNLLTIIKPVEKRLFFSMIDKQNFLLRLLALIVRVFPNTTCLHKALLIRYILRDDESIKINIGIRKKENKFESHAWLEKDGDIFLNNLIDLKSYKVILKK